METEDLFISLDRIRVAYTFRNLTDSDVTGEVIFPLPPISLGYMWNTDFNLPDDLTRPDVVNFTVTVDGKPVSPQIDRVAVLAGEWWDVQPGAAEYDTPGQDVTDLLGLPFSIPFIRKNFTDDNQSYAVFAHMGAERLAGHQLQHQVGLARLGAPANRPGHPDGLAAVDFP